MVILRYKHTLTISVTPGRIITGVCGPDPGVGAICASVGATRGRGAAGTIRITMSTYIYFSFSRSALVVVGGRRGPSWHGSE